MALIVENGGGVRGANSYQAVAAVTAYLTARNRQTENEWSTRTIEQQEAACIAATDYIDRRFGPDFLGRRAHTFSGAAASALVTLTANPSDGDAVTIEGSVYTFRSTASATFDVEIGADADGSAEALSSAINALETAFAAGAAGSTVAISASVEGEAGNFTSLAVAGAALTAGSFQGGIDGGDQVREWPRTGVRRRDGSLVSGLPRELLSAHAEYTVRAVIGPLEADPTVPTAGQGPITEETVRIEGAVLETTKWATPEQTTGATIIEPYPAADQLLADFVRRGSIFGRVGRV